jgi:hypothetical protein
MGRPSGIRKSFKTVQLHCNQSISTGLYDYYDEKFNNFMPKSNDPF